MCMADSLYVRIASPFKKIFFSSKFCAAICVNRLEAAAILLSLCLTVNLATICFFILMHSYLLFKRTCIRNMEEEGEAQEGSQGRLLSLITKVTGSRTTKFPVQAPPVLSPSSVYNCKAFLGKHF